MSPARPFRILVVEDDPAQLALFMIGLAGLGFHVFTAASSEEALPAVRARAFDAILTDNVLPGMSGVRCIAEYAKLCPGPVLVMTSDPSAEGEKDALMLGARRYLKKPVDLPSLGAELKEMLTRARDNG